MTEAHTDNQTRRQRASVSRDTGSAPRTLLQQSRALVHLGLWEFWQRALPVEDGVATLLRQQVRAAFASQSPDWQQERDGLTTTIVHAPPCPLKRLCDDFQLDASGLFMATLVGELENSHLLNLVVGELQAPDQQTRPTLHLIQALLDALFEDGDHSLFALLDHPLFSEQVLTQIGSDPLPLNRVQMEPRLWAVLCGRQTLWPGCRCIDAQPSELLASASRDEIESIAVQMRDASERKASLYTLVLRGNPHSGRSAYAQALAAAMNWRAVAIPFRDWREQSALALACRYANWLPVLRPALAPGEALVLPDRAQPLPAVLLLGSDGAVKGGNLLEVNLPLPGQAERLALWRKYLPEAQATLWDQLAAGALFSGPTIVSVAQHALRLARREQSAVNLSHLAAARRRLGAEKLRLLAQPVLRKVAEDTLVLPSLVIEGLQHIITRAGKREALWDNLGSTLRATPNPGVRALFVGESGTGKTLAASYIATQLAAPLYRVDLSAVMNKYIGESEKNLSQLLDYAAANDVVLLFDEADALFGSRSDGKETGERFANMLTNFLLTRIETHPGIVILTTNSRERIDNAFSRRIDAVVEFPLPGFDERLDLWRSHLGKRGPGEAVYRTLASYCDLAGGQLRNAVLHAAVVAQGTSISEAALLAGLRNEYRKHGRELPGKLEYLAANN